MDRVYALARMQWVEPEGGGVNWPMVGRYASPARFEHDQTTMWSLFVLLEQPVSAGDVVVIPVAPIIEEESERLLREGVWFNFTVDGKHTLAYGQVVEVRHASEQEFRRIFHFGEQDPNDNHGKA